jgi:EAL domain-containing protein (putative c-di-GMP-specific phosphodiesterase class I)
MDEALIQRQKLALDLRRAAERNHLTLRYQPIVCLDSGRVCGVEALVRWQHPDLGLLQPCDFIPVAEMNGTILDLDDWVLEQVARQVGQWRSGGCGIETVWVNLSVRQYSNAERVNRLIALLERLDEWKSPPCLGLEIVESRDLSASGAVADGIG